MVMGTSGSGKSFTLGGSVGELGVVHYFVEGLFNALNNAMESEPGVATKYTFRMQFVEMVNEEIIDLLSKGKRAINVEPDEWETVSIQGADKRVIGNAEQFAEIYNIGVQKKTNVKTEFGKLADKAATILTLDLIQVIESAADSQVLVSKVTFIECPGTEALAQNPEVLRVKQGPTLNQAIIALQDVVTDLASGKTINASSEASVFTKMLSEVLGGNTIGIAIFNFQCDNHQGSAANIKLLKQFQRIVNFPIPNDNRAICLLHKYRRESINLRRIIYGSGGETVEQYQGKITELQKKLISHNVTSMKCEEQNKAMSAKLIELKDKYNAMVRQKAEVQSQLLEVEEQKLSLSKGLIEQQIRNAQLQEELERIRYEQDQKGLHRDANINLLQTSRDRAQKTILDLEDSLNKMTKQKHEFELELMTVKKNYLNKCKDVDDLKKKNEQMGIELIKLINENKTIMGTMGIGQSGSKDNFEYYSKKIITLETEKERFKEELARAAAELETMHSDRIKNEVIMEQMKVDFEKKKAALEKEYVARARNHTVEESKVKENVWEDERLNLAKEVKELTRKLEVANAELNDANVLNKELKTQKADLELQLNEVTDKYRNKLVDMSEGESKKELFKIYNEKEILLKEEVETIQGKLERLRAKCKTLREYSRQLRYLCEDIYPEDKVRPGILLDDPPFIIKEEQEIVSSSFKSDLKEIKEENYSLKIIVDELKDKLKKVNIDSSGIMLHKRVMDELSMLKARPSSGIEELEKIRKEKNKLLEENIRLKQIVIFCYNHKDGARCSRTSFRRKYKTIKTENNVLGRSDKRSREGKV